MHKSLVALLISVLMIPTAGFAQAPPTSDGRDGAVGIPAIHRPAGILRAAVTRESVRFAALAPNLRQPQARERSWPGRHPVLCGALVGLGIGLGVEAAVIPGASGGEPHSVYVPMFGVIGAGIGTLAGLIVSAARR